MLFFYVPWVCRRPLRKSDIRSQQCGNTIKARHGLKLLGKSCSGVEAHCLVAWSPASFAITRRATRLRSAALHRGALRSARTGKRSRNRIKKLISCWHFKASEPSDMMNLLLFCLLCGLYGVLGKGESEDRLNTWLPHFYQLRNFLPTIFSLRCFNQQQEKWQKWSFPWIRAPFHHHCVLAAAIQKMRKYYFYRGAAAFFFRDLLCCCHVSAVVNFINTECVAGDKLHPAERVFGYRGPLWPGSLCAWPRLNGYRQGAVSWAWWVCQMKVLI